MGGAGIALGGAMRDIDPAVVLSTLQRVNGRWMVVTVVLDLTSFGLRWIRWGVLLRATDNVK